jgi:putative aldouronate transport system permease protein
MQTVYTFPHFLSWVLVGGILINFFSIDGVVNGIIKSVGGHPVSFLGSPDIFRPMLYITEIWKSSGWSAVIYLAAIAGIDIEQYEAAEIDGASRIQRIFCVTLPNISSTIAVLFIISVGNLMTLGFNQIFNLSNAAVRSISETLDMYIYNITFQAAADFSFSSAVSLFKSVINLLLLLGADKFLKTVSGVGLFGLKGEE